MEIAEIKCGLICSQSMRGRNWHFD